MPHAVSFPKKEKPGSYESGRWEYCPDLMGQAINKWSALQEGTLFAELGTEGPRFALGCPAATETVVEAASLHFSLPTPTLTQAFQEGLLPGSGLEHHPWQEGSGRSVPESSPPELKPCLPGLEGDPGLSISCGCRIGLPTWAHHCPGLSHLAGRPGPGPGHQQRRGHIPNTFYVEKYRPQGGTSKLCSLQILSTLLRGLLRRQVAPLSSRHGVFILDLFPHPQTKLCLLCSQDWLGIRAPWGAGVPPDFGTFAPGICPPPCHIVCHL